MRDLMGRLSTIVLLAFIAVTLSPATLALGEFKHDVRIEIAEDGSAALTIVMVASDDESLGNTEAIQTYIASAEDTGWEAKEVSSGGELLRGFEVRRSFSSSAEMERELGSGGFSGSEDVLFFEFRYSVDQTTATFYTVGRPITNDFVIMVEIIMPGEIRSVSEPGTWSGRQANYRLSDDSVTFEISVVSDLGGSTPDFSLLFVGATVALLAVGAFYWMRRRSSEPVTDTPGDLEPKQILERTVASSSDSQQLESRFCRNCGNRLAQEDRFCVDCGEPVKH